MRATHKVHDDKMAEEFEDLKKESDQINKTNTELESKIEKITVSTPYKRAMNPTWS